MNVHLGIRMHAFQQVPGVAIPQKWTDGSFAGTRARLALTMAHVVFTSIVLPFLHWICKPWVLESCVERLATRPKLPCIRHLHVANPTPTMVPWKVCHYEFQEHPTCPLFHPSLAWSYARSNLGIHKSPSMARVESALCWLVIAMHSRLRCANLRLQVHHTPFRYP